MGLNVMRWPLRPAAAKKYQVSIVLQSLEGLAAVGDGTTPGEGGGTIAGSGSGGDMKLIVVVKWKGSRGGLGSRFGMKRANSSSKLLQSTGSVGWDQTFENICAFSMGKDGNFQSWPVSFVVCKPSYGALRAKPFIVGTLQVDLAELVVGNTNTSGVDGGVHRFPITCNVGGSDIEATLSMTINFVELRTMFEGFEGVHKLMAPAIACMGEPMWDSDDERYVMSLKKKGGNGSGNENGSSTSSSNISGSSSVKGLTSRKASKKKSAAAATATTATATATAINTASSSTSITAASSSLSLNGGEVTETSADGKLSPLRIRVSGRSGGGAKKMIISSSAPPTSSDESLHGCSDNPFDSDSVGAEDSEVDDFVGEDGGSEVSMYEKHISYGTLAGANLVAEEVLPFDREEGSIVSDAKGEGGDGTAVLTVHSRATSTSTSTSHAVSLLPNSKTAVTSTTAEEPVNSSEMDSMTGTTFPSPLSMKGMLSWRKRKLSFRSPRARGEPLLNKAYGEEGGDEIDWDRRQSDAISSEELHLLKYRSGESLSATSSNATDVLDFGDELFTVGSWEQKELFSRDGLIKLSANVFFASFDQRSESAAGESACTALVAVIADWLHTHPDLMPSKAEFDMLIRDGSAEWRKLCEVDTYKDRFADRHFDLETVLEAGVRPLAVASDKSFVGFFKPERVDELGSEAFDFLKDAMTFDAIWDEIECGGPAVYIVSWNDHFFVLCIQERSCYIIDTLGERLYEGCNQAYILRFDETTTLCNVPPKPSKDSKGSATASGATVVAGAGAAAVASAETEGTHSFSGEKVEKTEKGDRIDKTHKLEKGDKIEKTHKLEKSEKSSRQAEVDVAAAGAGTGRGSAAAVGGDAAAAVEAGAVTSAGEDVGPAGGEVVLGGKCACRQFVKKYFAAIQLREAELEAKKIAAGKSTQTSIYQKLQIEFHYAKALEPFPASKSHGFVI